MIKKDILLIDIMNKPIEIVDFKRAFKLLVKGTAEVLHYYESVYINSPHLKNKKPSVIQIKMEWKNNSPCIKFHRNLLFKRDRYTCTYCNKFIKHDQERTVDHIIPISKGGDLYSWSNLITACSPCNNKKGDNLLENTEMIQHYAPIIPKTLMDLQLININVPPEWNNYL